MLKRSLTTYSLALASLLLGNCMHGVGGFAALNAKAFSTKAVNLSLWLIPPTPTFDLLQDQIKQLSQFGRTGPVFIPHITVVGGIVCQSEAGVVDVANILESGLAGFGKIPCSMSSLPSSMNTWNQALYLTVDLSAELLHLCRRSRALLGMEIEHWTFPAPAKCPHLSLYYGVDNIPDKSEVVISTSLFYAYSVALWCTDPPSLEGVTQWREVRRFNID